MKPMDIDQVAALMRRAADTLRMQIPLFIQDLQKPQRGVPPLPIEQVISVEKDLSALLDVAEFRANAAALICADPNLTAQGKEPVLRKLVQETSQGLADFEAKHVTKPRAVAEQRVASLRQRAAITRPTDPAALQIYAAQLQTLWSRFADADPLEIDLLAMTSVDSLTQDALATCPPVLRRLTKTSPLALVPVVNPERVAAATIARARATDPATVAAVESIERTVGVYEAALGGVRGALIEQAAGLAEDPIASAARGTGPAAGPPFDVSQASAVSRA
jgi:hypothetical protein